MELSKDCTSHKDFTKNQQGIMELHTKSHIVPIISIGALVKRNENSREMASMYIDNRGARNYVLL